ncbi:MAG: TrmH family RNA methyltransferase [Rhodopila sp.]
MKPPHGNRPGGPPRPPSDRGPPRGPGGHSSRPYGSGSGEQRSRDQQGQRLQGGASGGGQGAFYGGRPNRDSGKPQHGGGPREGFKPRHHGGPQREHGGQPDRGGPRHPPEAPKGTVWLYGLHAVAAALANPARRLRRLLLTEEAEATLAERQAPPWALPVERADRGRLDHLLGRDAVHQGAALLADPLTPPSLQSVLERPGVIVVLDQVTDPRNVGAILRSAAAFGAAAVITQERNAPEETGSLAKAASGALETMPLLRAVNIARTLIALKASNVWCIGLDAAGAPLSGPSFAGRRVALVLGAEGEGLRRLTKETCDEIAGLAIKGAVESLNVSAAASVALYELARR